MTDKTQAQAQPRQTKGAVTADGFTVVWVRNYYTLLTRQAEGGKAEWIAEMSDGARLEGTTVREVKTKARAYGYENGLTTRMTKAAAAAGAKAPANAKPAAQAAKPAAKAKAAKAAKAEAKAAPAKAAKAKAEAPAEPAAPAAAAVKITQLTAANVAACDGVADERGKTYVVFHGSADDALARVQARLDEVYAAEGGRAHSYASLTAVRRKLRRYISGEDTRHVTAWQ